MIIETVKQAEDGQGMILRLYESQRMQLPGRSYHSRSGQGAWITDLLEENLRTRCSCLTMGSRWNLNPYQIATLRVLFQ